MLVQPLFCSDIDSLDGGGGGGGTRVTVTGRVVKIAASPTGDSTWQDFVLNM